MASLNTEQTIERAQAEGLTAAQIERTVALWLDTNSYRAAQGFVLLALEDVMPRYTAAQS